MAVIVGDGTEVVVLTGRDGDEVIKIPDSNDGMVATGRGDDAGPVKVLTDGGNNGVVAIVTSEDDDGAVVTGKNDGDVVAL